MEEERKRRIKKKKRKKRRRIRKTPIQRKRLQKKRRKRRRKLLAKIRKYAHRLFSVAFVFSLAALVGYGSYDLWQNTSTRNAQKALLEMKEEGNRTAGDENRKQTAGIGDVFSKTLQVIQGIEISIERPDILQKYESIYAINQDMVGWLTINDTIIDYPVMQTMEDESYYLNYDFYGKKNKNGCLILDTDSRMGTGTKAFDYKNGTAPSTNLIIHGHTIRTGEMFGRLRLYADEKYGKKHNIIYFDSLYEEREYELIAAFYTQVYYEEDDVFKYYQFFQADTREEFDDWYDNIKEMSLYDTGVTAEFGDEFITLSCCSYQVEDGRFVVVGKRI